MCIRDRKDVVRIGPAESGKPWPPIDEAAAEAAAAQERAHAEREAAAARERDEIRAQLSTLRSDLESERVARTAAEQSLATRVESIGAKASEAPPSVGSAHLGLGPVSYTHLRA